SRRFDAEAQIEDLRTWRVFEGRSGIAQALRPAGTFDFTPTRNWDLRVTAAYSNNRSFHVYDAINDSVSISNQRSLDHLFHHESENGVVRYPIRFSAGFGHQD